MSGIIDNKKRVIDALLTLEGRRQLSEGGLRIDGYSFSDAGNFYSAELATGTSDVTVRLQLEACSLPQDTVTFETNIHGHVQPFVNDQGIQIIDGQVVEYSTGEGSIAQAEVLNGDDFSTRAGELIEGSIQNVRRLSLLTTRDELFDDSSFGLGNRSIEFVINNNKPLRDKNAWVANVNFEPSIFNDTRLNHVPNFKFLPPVTGLKDKNIDRQNPEVMANFVLGKYVPLLVPTISDDSLMLELEKQEALGYAKIVNFEPTSKQNNVLIQPFERNFDRLVKLKIVDRGIMKNSKGEDQYVFFVGKLILDDHDNHTFIHIFSLVFQ